MPSYTRPISVAFLTTGLVGTLGYTVIATDESTLVERTTDGVVESSPGVYHFPVVLDATKAGWIVVDDGAGTTLLVSFQARDTVDARVVGFTDGVITAAAIADGTFITTEDMVDGADVQAAAAAAISATTAKLPTTAPAGYGGASASATASAILSAVVRDGETLQQAVSRIRAALLGAVDYTSVPGTAVYKNQDGTEAFRMTYNPTTGRGTATLGS